MKLIHEFCYNLDITDMNEIIEQVTVKEMGSRFARIRKKMGLSQKQVGIQLGVTQKKISAIESGSNVLSPLFLAMILFYIQHVSAEMLFSKKFDIEDPHLFDKNYSLNSVAKAKLQLFSDQLADELEGKKKEWINRLKETADYL